MKFLSTGMSMANRKYSIEYTARLKPKILAAAILAMASWNSTFADASQLGEPEKFVAVVEWKFTRLMVDSAPYTKKLDLPEKSCASYTKYLLESDYSFFVAHGEGVVRSFQYAGIKVLPLQLIEPGIEESYEYNLLRLNSVFDCLAKLSEIPGFQGVNFSIDLTRPMDFPAESQKRHALIRADLAQKARLFLMKNPSAYLTIGVGNDRQRLEHGDSVMTDLCMGLQLPNIFCVTGILTGVGNSAADTPLLAYRFGQSKNLIALPTQSDGPTTSFLAPRLLRALIKKQPASFPEEFVLVPNLESTGSEKVLVRTLGY